MTTIGVLGATSHIARDFILRARGASHQLHLFSRRPQEVSAWLAAQGIAGASAGYESFGQHDYDLIVNFVGVGDPARAVSMGASILDITEKFDSLAIDHVKRHPATRYIFLSSGAVYGAGFAEPAGEDTPARIPVNALTAEHYYTVAKLYAETRHRALAPLPIVDIRVFSYFSRTADMTARFFLSDILRAIRDGSELETAATGMQRDYLAPDDFFALVECVMAAPAMNGALDAYTRAPVEKFALLEAMRQEFGLRYRVTPAPVLVSATGSKANYYSTNRRAEAFGYQPRLSSLEGILAESRALLR